jgi:hypothetical protein
MLLTVVLLMSTNVYAQNTENWDGDVNKDGVVDVADINAIIYLMKEAAGEYDGRTFYWYLGTTKPTDDAFIEANGNIASTPITSTIIFDNDNYQYFAWPKEWGEPTLIDTANNWEFTIANVASLKAAFDDNPNSNYNCRRVGKNTGDITCKITWK